MGVLEMIVIGLNTSKDLKSLHIKNSYDIIVLNELVIMIIFEGE
ncbi:MAG: hypothetical protein AB2376_03310 [Clostridium sp.]